MKEFSQPGSQEKTMVDLNRAIEATIKVACNEWKHVADLMTDFDPDLPKVLCLPNEINQVFFNLIVNAAHAIAGVVNNEPGAKGLIRIRTRQAGSWVEIRISATGAGTPEQLRDSIFEAFFTAKEAGPGARNSLALARSTIVDKHGGEVYFESTPGRESAFFIRLPAFICSTNEPGKRPSA
jgi:signal transduction histidine kinase